MQGYGQQPYMGGGGGYGMQLTPRTGDSVVHVKEEKVDPEYGEVERKFSSIKPPWMGATLCVEIAYQHQSNVNYGVRLED